MDMKIKKQAVLFSFLAISLLFLASCGNTDTKTSQSTQQPESSVAWAQEENTQANIAPEVQELVDEIEDTLAWEGDVAQPVVQESPASQVQVAQTAQVEETVEGSYSEYSSEKVAGARWDIVLFFHASWCPSCVSADKNMSSEEIPENLTLLKTDFDESTDLRKKYGVTSQHTFVQVDSEGNLIKKWVWGRDVQDVVERLQ